MFKHRRRRLILGLASAGVALAGGLGVAMAIAAVTSTTVTGNGLQCKAGTVTVACPSTTSLSDGQQITLSASATPTTTTTSTTTGSASQVLLGDQNVEATSDGSNAPASEAFGYTASASGTATSASIYLTSTDGATVGLYADSSGKPGALLDKDSIAANTAGWATVPLSGGAAISSGTRYWIAVGSNTGGQVTYRDMGNGGTNLDFSGTGFASPYSTTGQWSSNPISAYVSGTATTTTTTTTSTTSTTTTTPPPTGGISVSGNSLIGANGAPVVLHGTFITGPSYACEQNGGYGFSDTPIGDSLYGPMVSNAGGTLAKNWTNNSVAIFLNQDCWLGINGANPAYSGQNYINFVKAQVASAEKYGLYPVLVFGEGAPGTQQPNWGATDTGEAPMPDNDHMPLAWQQLANTFKADRNVIFRLYEEPWPNGTGTDLTTWKCWSRGDVQYGTVGLTPTSQNQNCNETYNGTPYKTVGMQSLLNIVRGTGATNVVQVPGVAFANMLACSATGNPTSCGFLDSADGVKVNDTLNPAQLVADTDNYPDAGQYCGSVACLTGSYDPVRQVMPLDIGEAGVFSGNNNSFPLIQQFIGQYDTWHQSYYASQWETWANLISSYNGTPASGWGTWYYNHTAG